MQQHVHLECQSEVRATVSLAVDGVLYVALQKKYKSLSDANPQFYRGFDDWIAERLKDMAYGTFVWGPEEDNDR